MTWSWMGIDKSDDWDNSDCALPPSLSTSIRGTCTLWEAVAARAGTGVSAGTESAAAGAGAPAAGTGGAVGAEGASAGAPGACETNGTDGVAGVAGTDGVAAAALEGDADATARVERRDGSGVAGTGVAVLVGGLGVEEVWRGVESGGDAEGDAWREYGSEAAPVGGDSLMPPAAAGDGGGKGGDGFTSTSSCSCSPPCPPDISASFSPCAYAFPSACVSACSIDCWGDAASGGAAAAGDAAAAAAAAAAAWVRVRREE
ncbi:unnamed protein product [Closterium sp. NIES-64]|nr:unnamed protein product [Closterium sp. NIES-64]